MFPRLWSGANKVLAMIRRVPYAAMTALAAMLVAACSPATPEPRYPPIPTAESAVTTAAAKPTLTKTQLADQVRKELLKAFSVNSLQETCDMGGGWSCQIFDIESFTLGAVTVGLRVIGGDKDYGQSVARSIFMLVGPQIPDLDIVQVCDRNSEPMATVTRESIPMLR